MAWLYQNTSVSQTTLLVTGSSKRKSVAHVTPDLQQPASTCQPVFQKSLILGVFSNLLRVLPEEKTEFTQSILAFTSEKSLLEATEIQQRNNPCAREKCQP